MVKRALNGSKEQSWFKKKTLKVDVKGYVAKGVFFFPPIWPGAEQNKDQPGNLDFFTHYDAILDMYQQTWGIDCQDVMRPHHLSHTRGMVAYFDPNEMGYIGNLLDFFRLDPDMRDYAAFVCESKNPRVTGYLRQVRIVSKEALTKIFGIETIKLNGNTIPLEKFSIDQNINLQDLILLFICTQDQRWLDRSKLNSRFSDKRIALEKAAKELVFGLMVEDKRYPVLRIWSMAELAHPPKG